MTRLRCGGGVAGPSGALGAVLGLLVVWLLAVVGAGVLPVGAQADPFLVSNTGQTRTTSASNNELAQSFETGSFGDGYDLSEIGVYMGSDGGASVSDGAVARVYRDNGSGRPGMLLTVLENPASFTSDAVNSFTAPGDVVLEPDTTYWLVLNEELSTRPSFATTNSVAEDSGSLEGDGEWEIGDGSLWRGAGDTNWNTETILRLLRVVGTQAVDLGIESLRVRDRLDNLAVVSSGESGDYLAYVPFAVDEVAVEVAADNDDATVTVSDGSMTVSGSSGEVFELAVGVTEFEVTVTDSDSNEATYTLHVHRAGAGFDESVLVSNELEVLDVAAESSAYVGQEFVTGPNEAGYVLREARVYLGSGNSDPAKDVAYVQLWEGDGTEPSDKIADLANPDVLSDDGFNVFSAPPGLELEADTKYWIVVNNNDTGDPDLALSYVNSDGEALESSVGWSIHDSSRPATDWDNPGSASLRMSLHGTALNDGTIDFLVRNTASGIESGDLFLAASFNTGPVATGYTLDRVHLNLGGSNANLDTANTTYVQLWEGERMDGVNTPGAPGVKIADLANPPVFVNFSNGRNRFTAPAGTVLKPNTKYWLVVNNGVNPKLTVRITSDDDEAGSLEGWFISDRTFLASTNWTNVNNKTLSLLIYGYPNDVEAPLLSSLEVSNSVGGDELGLTPEFAGGIGRYSVAVDDGAEVDVSTGLGSGASSVVIEGDDDPATPEEATVNTDVGLVGVSAVAGDGLTTNTYELRFRGQDASAGSDATLASLELSDPGGGAVTFLPSPFDPAVGQYRALVNTEVSSLTLSWTTSDADASVVANAQGRLITDGIEWTLAEGSNTAVLTVISGDGSTTETYTVNVTRPASTAIELVSNTTETLDATLSAGNKDASAVRQAFKTGLNPFGYSVSSVGVHVDSESFSTGETVTAGIYEIGAGNSLGDLVGSLTAPASFTDDAVNSFTASGIALEPDTDYQVAFGSTGDAAADLKLSLTSSDIYTSSDDWEIEDGRRITNGNLQNRSLAISVHGLAYINQSALSSLTVEEDSGRSMLDPAFDPVVTEYSFVIANGRTEVTLDAVAADPDATVAITGNTTGLVMGDNTIEIEVTGTDSSVTTYTVTVTREAPLTGRFTNRPASHTGVMFAYNLKFNADVPSPVGGGGSPVAASATFTPVGSGVISVDPDDRSSYLVIAQTPEVGVDFVVTIAAPADCADAGAVCTALGTPLLNDLVSTVPPAMPALRVSNVSVDEGQALAFEITMTQAWPSDVTVDWATSVESGDTATLDTSEPGGADFTDGSGMVTFSAAASETTKTVMVATADDSVNEQRRETFTFTLSNPQNAVFTRSSAKGTIVDNHGLPGITVPAAVTVDEGGTATFDVALADDPTHNVTVAITSGDTDAVTVSPTTPLTFTPTNWNTVQTVTVTGVEDDNFVGETTTVTLTATSNDNDYQDVQAEVDVTTADNDLPEINFAATTASATEGQLIAFNVALEAVTDVPVDFSFELFIEASDTATFNAGHPGGSDFGGALAGNVTVAAGQTAAAFLVRPRDDATDEYNETFTVKLTSAQYAVLGTNIAAVGTIIDNDDPPSLIVLGQINIDEDFVGESPQLLRVSLDAVSGKTVTVDYVTEEYDAANSATVNVDFDQSSGTAQFDPGHLSVAIPPGIIDDELDEASESYAFCFENPQNAVPATTPLGCTDVRIIDNDPTPTASISDAQAPEGVNLGFEVSLSAVSGRDITMRYTATPSGTNPASAGLDYTAPAANAELTIPAGTDSGIISVPTLVDMIDEPDGETLTLTLGSPLGVILGTASAIGTITDDPVPRITAPATATVDEGGTATFQVELATEPTHDVTVTIESANTDAVTTTAALTFTETDWNTAQTVTVTGVEDDNFVGESITVTLTAASDDDDYEGVQAEVDVTTADNDDPEISFQSATSTQTEGELLPATLSLSGTTDKEVRVQYQISIGPDDTATLDVNAPGGSDIDDDLTGFITIPAGLNEGTIHINTTDDTTDEDNETFTVTLTNATNAELSADDIVAVATIFDNDDPPGYLVTSQFLVLENAPTSSTVLLDEESGKTVTIDYETDPTRPGTTADEGDDYQIVSGTVEFAPGETSKSIPVGVINDSLDEHTEKYFVCYTNPQNAAPPNSTPHCTEVTITDDDPEPFLRFQFLEVEFRESSAGAEVVRTTLVKSGGSNATSGKNVSVDYQIVHGTTSDADFTDPLSGRLVVPPGAVFGNIGVELDDFDCLDEHDETFTVVLSNANNAVLDLNRDEAVVTVLDRALDDPPSLSVADVVVDEDAGVAVLTVSLDNHCELVSPNVSGKDIEVSYSTQDVSGSSAATAGDDYTAQTNETLEILAGNETATIEVPITNDTDAEDNEVFEVRLAASPTNATIDDGTASVEIVDDDTQTVTMAAAQLAVDEDKDAVIEVSLSPASTVDVVVDYTVTAGTATAGVDYEVAADMQVTFAAGETTKTFTVAIVNDGILEIDEDFTVELTGVSAGARLGSAVSTAVTILDDDTANVRIVNATYLVDEGDSLTLDIVVRSAGGDGSVYRDVDIEWKTIPATATPDGDYRSVTGGTVTILAGESSAQITVETIEDELHETLRENFAVQLGDANVTDVRVNKDPVTVSISDDDDPPTVSVAAAEAQEGDDLEFEVSLSAESGLNTTVAYSVAPSGTNQATPGVDYTAPASDAELVIPAGQMMGNITVATLVDMVDEDAGETLTLTLTNAEFATLGTATATGTITDEPVLGINVSPRSVTVNEDGTATFTVKLHTEPTDDVTVAVTSGDIDAVTVSDAELTFTDSDWNTAQEVTVTGVDDDNFVSESVTVSLDAASSDLDYDDAGAEVTVTTVDNDLPEIAFTTTTGSAEEGGSISFGLELEAATDVAVQYSYEVSIETGDTATFDTGAPGGNDFNETVHSRTGTGSIPAGLTSTVISVQFRDDSTDEHDETFTLTLTGTTYAVRGTDIVATGTILDNDDPPTIVYEASVPVVEGETATAFISFPEVSGKTVSVDYATDPSRPGSTATVGEDYAEALGTVEFAPGEQLQFLEVAAIDDSLYELFDESYFICFSNPVNATLPVSGDRCVEVEIGDGDDPPVASVAGAQTGEGADLEFEVLLSAVSGLDATVGYSVMPSGSYPATPGVDYTPPASNAELVIPAGQTSGIITVATLVDMVDEDTGETLTLTLTRAEFVTFGTASATGTITDEPVPGINASSRAVTLGEAGTAEFTVKLHTEPTHAVTVTVSSGDTDAATVSPASLSFTTTDWETAQTVTVSGVQDADGVDESVTVTLQASSTDSEYANEFTVVSVSVVDDDVPNVSVDQGSLSVAEGASEDFGVSLATAPSQAVTVSVTSLDPSAASVQPATLTFSTANWATTQTVTVSGVPDDRDAADESTAVRLAVTLSGADYANKTAQVQVTVIDDDEPELSISDAAGAEGGTVSLAVTLSIASPTVVTVDYSTSDRTARAPADYTAVSGTLTFSPGQTSKQIQVSLADDTAAEPVETFAVTLSASGGTLITRSSATVTITDNDPPAQVTGVEVFAGDTELDVSWDPVPFADSYKVQWRSGSQPYSDARQAVVTAGTRHTVTGLTNNTQYTLEVIATRNSIGDGAPSEEVAQTPILNADRASDDTGTTEEISAGTSWINGNALIGRIDARNDVDWYRVTLTAGNCYQIEARGKRSWDGYLAGGYPAKYAPTAPLTLTSPRIAGIHNTDGDYIPGTEGRGDLGGLGSSIITVRPDTGGTYYIAVTHRLSDSSYTNPGTFDLSVIDLGPDTKTCTSIP